MKRDVERLRALQNDDGGFGFWRRGDESWPYVSIHVAHALARAKAKGFAVPDDTLERSRGYLREIERHIPSDYGKDVRRTLQAYALSVRALSGDADPARARSLVREAGVEGLSFEALGWVLPVLSKDAASTAEVTAIRRRLANNVAETAAAAHFAVSYGDGAHLLLHSDRRADAVLLEALIADQPRSDLIPKLVEGLLAHRTAGRWSNTQENVFVLLALDRYFQAYEKTTPDFVARVWLGERYAGSHEFRGRTTERHHVSIPMAYLREAKGASDLLSPRRERGGSTTGSACATRRRASCSSRSTAASPWSAPTREWTTRRTCVATATAPGGSAPARASACGSRWSRPPGATTWRSWTRCRPGSSRSTRRWP